MWLLTLCAVPFWLQINAGVAFPPTAIAFAFVLPTILRIKGKSLRGPDYFLVVFVGLSAMAVVLAHSPGAAFGAVIVQWTTAYLVGRYLAPAAGKDWTYQAISYATAFVAAWACLEYALDLHVFMNFPGTTNAGNWAAIQYRGAHARSEGAFGHAIALGGFIAMGFPFVMVAKIRTPVRALILALLSFGMVTSLSRGPLIGAVVTVLVAVVSLPTVSMTARRRVWLGISIGIGAAIAAPRVLGVFAAISPTELEPSADYRTHLFQSVLHDLNILGPSEGLYQDASGQFAYRSFRSIDNAYALIGLQFGWLPLLLLASGLVLCAWQVLRRRGGPADVALIGQTVTLAFVALITQYGAAVWLLVGMAVAFRSRRGQDASLPDAVETLGVPLSDRQGGWRQPSSRGRSDIPSDAP
jgi:hypothetical protein